MTSSPMMTVTGKKKRPPKTVESSGFPGLSSRSSVSSAAGRRITAITMTLARKIDSSPSVSSPRWSKLTLETTLAVAWWTAAGMEASR